MAPIKRFGVLGMSLLVALGTGFGAAAQEEGPCLIWHEAESDQPFIPSVMEIRLNGNVGPDMENQLIGVLNDFLTTYPSLKTVKILISSTGGYIENGFKIHNYLQGLHSRHQIQVVTHNTGSVQSSAVDIYCSGNQRIASPYSFFMVHESSQALEGTYDIKAIEDLSEENRIGTASSQRIFSGCTSLPVGDVAPMFTAQTYLGADKALELGLAHSILPATYDRSADIRCLIESNDLEVQP